MNAYANATANITRAHAAHRFDRSNVAPAPKPAHEQFEAVRRLHEAVRTSGAKVRSTGMASCTRAMELVLREARS